MSYDERGGPGGSHCALFVWCTQTLKHHYEADSIVYMQDMGLLRAHDAQCFALVVPCACHVLRDRRQLTVANGAAVSRFEAASG